jgi:hypothetical protein
VLFFINAIHRYTSAAANAVMENAAALANANAAAKITAFPTLLNSPKPANQ